MVDQEDHPLAVILSQDCDLDWDFQSRHSDSLTTSGQKLLANVLLADLISVEELRNRGVNSAIWSRIRDNKDERYQFLRASNADEDLQHAGVPEGVIDFKRFFSLRPEEIYFQLEHSAHRRSRLLSPYVEHLSVRFFNFHARIALPAEHWQNPARS